MLIEDWGLSGSEAARALGITVGQFRHLRERLDAVDTLETSRGRRSEYRFDHMLRVQLAIMIVEAGLLSRSAAVAVANRTNVVSAYISDGEIAFGLVRGKFVEMGWKSHYDPRVVFPLEGAAADIVEAIRQDIETAKGATAAEAAVAEFNGQIKRGVAREEA